jgi:hypothetical protein
MSRACQPEGESTLWRYFHAVAPDFRIVTTVRGLRR